MELNEAIRILAIGFLFLIGFWLTTLTYLVLKRHRQNNVAGGVKSMNAGDKEEIHIDQAE